MCIIIASPPGERIPKDALLDAIFENPDGTGYVFAYKGSLVTDRDAKDGQRIVDAFLRFQDAHPECWGVFHARIATQGTEIDANTHPFSVPGQPWALAHNGVMPLSDGPWGDRSDSRILAEDHVAHMSWADLLATKEDTERWLRNNKVVILSARRERGGRCIIYNESKGHWSSQDKCWYSHYQSGARTRKPYKQWDYADGWDLGAFDRRHPAKGKTYKTRIEQAADILAVSEDDIRGWAGNDKKAVAQLVDEILGTGNVRPIKPKPDVDMIDGKWEGETYVGNDGQLWEHDYEHFPTGKDANGTVRIRKMTANSDSLEGWQG